MIRSTLSACLIYCLSVRLCSFFSTSASKRVPFFFDNRHDILKLIFKLYRFVVQKSSSLPPLSTNSFWVLLTLYYVILWMIVWACQVQVYLHFQDLFAKSFRRFSTLSLVGFSTGSLCFSNVVSVVASSSSFIRYLGYIFLFPQDRLDLKAD